MNIKTISPENILQNIIDFDYCKKMVDTAKKNNETMVILCPHYSINIASKFEDCEQLQYDMDELSEYLDEFVEVSDYDDMIVYVNYPVDED